MKEKRFYCGNIDSGYMDNVCKKQCEICKGYDKEPNSLTKAQIEWASK